MLDTVQCDRPDDAASRVIKRYSNRKLYDTRSSKYVTLVQIARMVRDGEEVRIIDNRTKEDKTQVTLALIISEELKNSPGGIPLTILRSLIRNDSSPPPSGVESPEFGGSAFPPPLSGPAVSGAVLAHPEIRASSRVDLFSTPEWLEFDFFFDGLFWTEEAPVSAETVSQDSEARRAARAKFERWQSSLTERMRELPDSAALVALQSQIERLNARLAEVERQLAKSVE